MKKLLDKYTNEQIITRLVKKYPDQANSREGYDQALNELRKLKPIKNDWKVSCCLYGSRALPIKPGGFYRSIGANNWGFILGTTPLRATLDSLCNILWEITYHGFSAKAAVGFYKKLFKQVAKIGKKVKYENLT